MENPADWGAVESPSSWGAQPAQEDPSSWGAIPASEAGASLSDIWEGANAPLIHAVPKPFPEPNPEDSTLTAIGKGAANLPSDVLNFLQSPIGIVTAGVGGALPKAAQALVAAGFSTEQAISAVNAKTPQERYEALFGAGLAGLGALHGLKGTKEATGTGEIQTERPTSVPEAAPSVETPPVAQNANTGRLEPITARYQEPPTSEADLAAANAELAQGGPPAPEFPVLPGDPVKAVAVRDDMTGRVYSGAPGDIHASLDQFVNSSRPFTEGFITDSGQFLDRRSAWEKARGQLTPEALEQERDTGFTDLMTGDFDPPQSAISKPNVREAISLDELRLMRERSDLQLQNELAKRVGGASHPAIDERLAQIDQELQDIANTAVAKPFEPVPADVNETIRQNEADRLAREKEDATFRPENEPRPLDEAVTRGSQSAESVGQPAGQRIPAPQQPAGLGARPQPQASPPSGAPSPKVGVAETYANAELGDNTVIPGEGVTWQQARDFGTKYINDPKGDPRLPIRRAKTSQRVGWQDVGIVSAEYERLAGERRAAANALNADPTNPALLQNYKAAEKAQVDWRREMQPVLTKASDALRAAQGERVVNTSDFNDLMDYAILKMGKNVRDLTPPERTALARVAKDNQRAEVSRVQAADKVRMEVRRQAGGKTMSLDDLIKQSEDFFKRATADCVT